MKRPSAKFLVTFSITLVMLSLHFASAYFEMIPDVNAIKRDSRAALAEVLTVRSVRHLGNSEVDILEEGLEMLLERNPDILSVAVRRADGNELIKVGDHNQHWNFVESKYSTDSQLTVPIMESGRQWGQLELSFAPLGRQGWIGYLDKPLIKHSLFLTIFGFIAFYYVLGKLLKHLDPSKAIPTRVRSALDTMMEGLIAIDLKGQIMLANQAFAALAGKTPEQLMGTKIGGLSWHMDSNTEANTAQIPWDQTLLDGTPRVNAPIHFDDANNKRRTFLVNCSPVMGGDGKHVGVLVGLGDVTQLEEKEVELRISKDRAEAANRAKTEFLANMSHEIRTPMNAILGFTEMLKRGHARSEADSNKYLNTIHSSGTFLLELINDLLDISKIEAGSLEMESVECRVQDIAREVINVLSAKAAAQNITLEFDVETPVPASIISDPMRLRQVITNLIGNAIKFTALGGVRVVLRYDPQTDPGSLALDVIDTGIGMNAGQIEKVFNPFVQADRTITRRFGGTGLGLSISQSFAKALGGEILVRSTPGVGSVFTVLIKTGSLVDVPVITPEVAMRIDSETEQGTHTAWKFPQARVLVADDNKANRDLLRLVLEEYGLRVSEAANGQEAYTKASETSFDLILMDLEMPVMDGVTAARKLRTEGVDVPILVLTAHARESVQTAINESVFSGYIGKPINFDDLIEHLATLLGGVKTHRAAEQPETDAQPIVSRLPMDDPRYRDIVSEFVAELSQRLLAIERACKAHDFAELARLCDSLKGLAGTVGFTEFTGPVRALENAAITESANDLDELFDNIKALAARVVTADGPHSETQQTVIDLSDSELPDTAPVTSSLPLHDPRYRAILVEFVDELPARFDAMEKAAERSNYGELKSLAHAFKGVAGNVGFTQFAAPTRSLEAAAKNQSANDAIDCIALLREVSSRIDISPPQTSLQQVAGA